MTYIIPYNHKRDLRAVLESAGWGIELVEPPAEAWWMHELWQVRSRFRPVGVEAFVAFVGGPDGAGEPHPGASHITVGPIPTSWQNSENLPSFALSKNWQSEQKRLIDLLSKIQNSEIEPN